MKRLCFFILIFLVGCSSYQPYVVYETIEKNICENNTIYIVNETIRYINLTETVYVNNDTIYINDTEPCVNNTINTIIVNQSNSSYIIGLIKQIKRLEKQQDKYYNSNISDCVDDLNSCSVELEDLKEKIEGLI